MVFFNFPLRNPSTTAHPSMAIEWPQVAPKGPNFDHVEIVAPHPIVRHKMDLEEKNLAFWLQLSGQSRHYDLLFEMDKQKEQIIVDGMSLAEFLTRD
jgi:hypothetical protein